MKKIIRFIGIGSLALASMAYAETYQYTMTFYNEINPNSPKEQKTIDIYQGSQKIGSVASTQKDGVGKKFSFNNDGTNINVRIDGRVYCGEPNGVKNPSENFGSPFNVFIFLRDNTKKDFDAFISGTMKGKSYSINCSAV